MGAWSEIGGKAKNIATGATLGTASGVLSGVGFAVKNGIKATAGYYIGDALSKSDNGMGGLAGIAGIYAIPAIFNKVRGKDKLADSHSFWHNIVKTATVIGIAGVGGAWALKEYNTMSLPEADGHRMQAGESIIRSSDDLPRTTVSIDEIVNGMDTGHEMSDGLSFE